MNTVHNFKKNDLTLSYYDYGGQSSRVLLFAHAASFCGEMWYPIINFLKKDFRCIAIDIRGHGRSQFTFPDTIDMSWDQAAEDISDLMQDIQKVLNLNQSNIFYGVGHSMGGTLLLLDSIQNTESKFEKLWLFEPIFFSNDNILNHPRTSKLVTGSRKRRANYDSPAAALKHLGSKPPMNSFSDESLEAYVKYGFQNDGSNITLRCLPEVESLTYANANTGIIDIAKKINISVEIMVGENDDDRVPAILQSVLGLSKYQIIQDDSLNHFGPQQDPKKISEAIIKFFSS